MQSLYSEALIRRSTIKQTDGASKYSEDGMLNIDALFQRPLPRGVRGERRLLYLLDGDNPLALIRRSTIKQTYEASKYSGDGMLNIDALFSSLLPRGERGERRLLYLLDVDNLQDIYPSSSSIFTH
ncbi:hypothetical protein CEXT_566631 [Caerostris extrusa]|uniref:Uncharacterized protein n=1 Tax=Caerostris extrusa TaxID=172846 RepID=A0AAV4WNM2_CAEEX|nr:hypothetical protein CEXT_566631 [Caerostris extrusa]